MSDIAADPRPQLYAAFDQASRIVAGVAPDHLRRSTPCTEFDVTALTEHLVGVARRVAAVGRGESQDSELDVSSLAEDGFAKAFDEARQEAFASWAVLPVATQVLPPEPRGGEIPFGPVVDVAEGASAYDQLAGYLGRRPA